jgi:putative phosphonate transport system ATP-binding protein
MSVLAVEGVAKLYGRPCGACVAQTGPAVGDNRCPTCGTIVACAGVDFTLHAGEVLGIVGESGSGKSSLAEVLALSAPATAGEVRYQHAEGNLLEVGYEQRTALMNEHIGMVHQHIRDGLTLGFTGGGNIAEQLLAAGWRNYGAIRDRVTELFAATEVPTGRMDDVTATYSGGMQRRVQIAKALANDPSLIILDEPTTGLDVSVQARVLDLIRKLQRTEGVAMIVVSHDLDVIRLLADRTLVMRHGRVIERGLTDQIMEDPHASYTQTLINSVL